MVGGGGGGGAKGERGVDIKPTVHQSKAKSKVTLAT